MVSQKSDDRSPSSVQNGPVIQDDLCPHQHACHLGHVVPYFVVVEQLAPNPFNHQFFIEFDPALQPQYPSARDPLLQTYTSRLSSRVFAIFLRLKQMDLE